jgi:hypothetical protein
MTILNEKLMTVESNACWDVFNIGNNRLSHACSFHFRRRLMEYDSRLLSLSAEAERQHAVISQWESQNNKLYKNNHSTATRWHHQRPNTDPDFEVGQGLSI